LLLCVCAVLPAKAVPEMTSAVSSGTLNPTHSLTHALTINEALKVFPLFSNSLRAARAKANGKSVFICVYTATSRCDLQQRALTVCKFYCE